jgi:hypothetical protein
LSFYKSLALDRETAISAAANGRRLITTASLLALPHAVEELIKKAGPLKTRRISGMQGQPHR